MRLYTKARCSCRGSIHEDWAFIRTAHHLRRRSQHARLGSTRALMVLQGLVARVREWLYIPCCHWNAASLELAYLWDWRCRVRPQDILVLSDNWLLDSRWYGVLGLDWGLRREVHERLTKKNLLNEFNIITIERWRVECGSFFQWDNIVHTCGLCFDYCGRRESDRSQRQSAGLSLSTPSHNENCNFAGSE